MFSDIQNIRSASEPLKAEAVDSRLSNKKEGEGEFRGKSNKNSPAKEEDAMPTGPEFRADLVNSQSVNRFSVDSLIFFLEDFLEERITGETSGYFGGVIDPEEPQENAQDVSTIAPWLRSKPNNLNVPAHLVHPVFSSSSKKPEESRNVVAPRYAAHAYAHRAMLNDVSQQTRLKVREHVAKSGLSSDTQGNKMEEGIRDIYNLIRDLRDLKQRGITHLDVKDDAALFEGISTAIRTDVA